MSEINGGTIISVNPTVRAFVLPITATTADIDDVGHVSNVVYVRWLQEIGMAHSNSLGWTWQRYLDFGGVFVVKRHEIDYGYSIKLGDSIVGLTWIESMKGVSCIRRTEIRHVDKVAVTAATTWVMVNLASGRPQRIPTEIQQMFLPSKSNPDD
jgi:acyl-CoA thioester hydrolase